jgi:hypothetical protein
LINFLISTRSRTLKYKKVHLPNHVYFKVQFPKKVRRATTAYRVPFWQKLCTPLQARIGCLSIFGILLLAGHMNPLIAVLSRPWVCNYSLVETEEDRNGGGGAEHKSVAGSILTNGQVNF